MNSSGIISRQEATDLLNDYGVRSIPFLVLVDFEMARIRVFRTDIPLPPHVRADFTGNYIPTGSTFSFKKYPVPIDRYRKSFDLVQDEIRKGNTFLLNLTFPTSVETTLTPREIFLYSQAACKIMLENEFVCFSPELFVKMESGTITTFPMKGTRRMHEGAARLLLDDKKEIAEHATVADLLRNDLSRVARSVEIIRWRYLQQINTHAGPILQMSSEIAGKLDKNWNRKLGSILFELLPAGSVTGAPKQKTVEIIRKAEDNDRGYYTGICANYDGTCLTSYVMIRFIECLPEGLWFRSGGGITHMSRVEDEYNEMIDKVYVPIV